MAIVVRRTFKGRLLSKNFACVAVDADHLEGVFAIRAEAIRMHKIFALDGLPSGLRSGHDGSFNRSR